MIFKQKQEPELGSKKTVRKFLWFPEKVNGAWAWFETVILYLEYQEFTEKTVIHSGDFLGDIVNTRTCRAWVILHEEFVK